MYSYLIIIHVIHTTKLKLCVDKFVFSSLHLMGINLHGDVEILACM